MSGKRQNSRYAAFQQRRQTRWAKRNSRVFSRRRWDADAKTTLLTSTNAVDNLCRALVDSRGLAHGVAVREIRDLALTVAVLERALYTYAEELAQRQSISVSHSRSSSVASFRPSMGAASPGAVPSVHNRNNYKLQIQPYAHSPSPGLTSMPAPTSDRPAVGVPIISKPVVPAEKVLLRKPELRVEILMKGALSNSQSTPASPSPASSTTRPSTPIGETQRLSTISEPTSVPNMFHATTDALKVGASGSRSVTPAPVMAPSTTTSLPGPGPHSLHTSPRHATITKRPAPSPPASVVSASPYLAPDPAGQRPRHTHMPGGVVSLLRLLTSTLDSTREVLANIRDCASFTTYLRTAVLTRKQLVLFATSSLILYQRRANTLIKHAWRYLFRKVEPYVTVKVNLLVELLATNDVWKSKVLRLWMLGLWPMIWYWMYRRRVRSQTARLQQLHQRLLFLLRLWQMCISVMNLQNEPTLALTPTPPEAQMVMSQWLLELVPPNLSASFWYQSSFQLRVLKHALDVLYASVSFWYQWFGQSPLALPVAFPIMLYYLSHPGVAAKQSSTILASPDVRLITAIWGVLDSWPFRLAVRILTPKVALMQELQLADRRPTDFSEVDVLGFSPGLSDLSEGETETSQFLQHDSPSASRSASDSSREGAHTYSLKPHNESRLVREGELTVPLDQSQSLSDSPHSDFRDEEHVGLISYSSRRALRSETVHVTLLSSSDRELVINPKLRRAPSEVHLNSASTQDKILGNAAVPVVIYLHGGGWVASFKNSDIHHLSHWAVETEAPIIYVNYSLAPESAYPTALDECYAVYKWVSDGRLGVSPTNIILVGDSSGAHIALGMCMRAIIDDVRVPDGLMLAYPTLSMGFAPTTSKAVYMMDPVAPMNLLQQCASVYLPSHLDEDVDPCVAPLQAPDTLLRAFPPTTLLVGDIDPFLDDSVQLAHRLTNNGVPVRLQVFESLPHHFLNFSILLPDARKAMLQAGKWLKQMLYNTPLGRR